VQCQSGSGEIMTSLKEKYNKEIIKKLKEEFEHSSDFQVPKITSISINVGVGKIKESKEDCALVAKDISLITGQLPRFNKARMSVSGFKLREGQIVGYSLTLRNKKMYDFIERFVNVSLPRIRDFRGLLNDSFDQKGNYSIGIKEHTIFPEIKYDNVKQPFSMQVNFSITAKNKKEAKRLLEHLGFPFEKKKDKE
jgi:large subunit ribosomal protein L5